ncbi:MAG: glucokinase [Myxococcota bacterium]
MKVLAGDVGGTNTRLALVENGEVVVDRRYPSADHAGLEGIVQLFLKAAGEMPERACFGVAGPVENDVCRVTNLPWVVDARAIEKATGIKRARVVNDFYAAALGVTVLSAGQTVQLGGKQPHPTGPIAVLGAGTGLGVAFLVHNGLAYDPIPSEGGHRDFAPRNDVEIRLLQFLTRQFGRVSYERICSGPGLKNLYEFFESEHPNDVNPVTRAAMETEDPAAVVSRLGLTESDPCCAKALHTFVSILGAEAGNLALQVVATGGVYVAGGIPPRLINKLTDGTFRAAFETKGRLSPMVKEIPAYVVMEPHLGLLGAAVAASRL